MALAVWHAAYVIFSERGHRQFMAMLPRRSDWTDIRAMLAYYLGRRDELPAFSRFNPIQKLQYWGAGLGSALMIVTGLVLWTHTTAMTVLPKWFLDLTVIVHGYEGLILFLVLFGWHLYIVHLAQGNFPLQRTFIDGRISRERLWREHRREYVELYGPAPPPGAGGNGSGESRS
jgi:cytochrome b subunit of formate dehydrogenase